MGESPTDGTGDQSGGSDEPVLDEHQQDPSAENQEGTETGDTTQDSDQSDTEPQHGTTQQDEGSEEDDGLDNFIKSQGLEPDKVTENERKAFKVAHDNVKEYRKLREQKTEETHKALDEVNTLEDGDTEQLSDEEAWQASVEARQSKIEANLRATEFFTNYPEAREYEKDMGQLILAKAKALGKPAAQVFASDLHDVFILAKARRGSNEEQRIADEARRQERERLRKQQEAGADGSQATNPHESGPKITKEWVDEEYDPSNPEHRKAVDEAIARGDLY